MKRILLLIAMPFAFLSALTAQITQEQADAAVLEHMNGETRPYAIYAHLNAPVDDYVITTAAGEKIELDYACWIYYIRYADQPDNEAVSPRRYLVVEKEDGNLLEVRTRNDLIPHDMVIWRAVPIYSVEIQLINFPLPEEECDWLIAFPLGVNIPVLVINSQEMFTRLFSCGEKIPTIDFSNYSLIVVYAGDNFGDIDETYHLIKTGENQYQMSADNIKSIMALVPKMPDNTTFDLNVNYQVPAIDFSLPEGCDWQNIKEDTVYLINSKAQLSAYLSCQVEDIPDIDFRNYSLLFAKGYASNGISKMERKLFLALPGDEYILNIELTLDDTTEYSLWTVALLTSKIAPTSKMKLNVQTHH